jgi:hypothetical protein
MSFLQILPPAFVMIAGPHIITSFFLASEVVLVFFAALTINSLLSG